MVTNSLLFVTTDISLNYTGCELLATSVIPEMVCQVVTLTASCQCQHLTEISGNTLVASSCNQCISRDGLSGGDTDSKQSVDNTLDHPTISGNTLVASCSQPVYFPRWSVCGATDCLLFVTTDRDLGNYTGCEQLPQ